jgi:hypothetical protein
MNRKYLSEWDMLSNSSDSSEAFRKQYLSEWDMSDDAVFSASRVRKWLEAGEITEQEANILLRLTYDVGRDGKRKFHCY